MRWTPSTRRRCGPRQAAHDALAAQRLVLKALLTSMAELEAGER